MSFQKIIINLGCFSTKLFIVLSFCASPVAFAKEYRISSANELKELERSLVAGDVVVLNDGTWHNQIIKLVANGRLDKPITLKADTLGKVILTGNSRVFVKGSHVVVSGLMFTDGALEEKGHIIRLEGSHHRLTETAIIRYNPESIDTRYFWVSLFGDHHRVDHNFFSGQEHSGVTNVVWLRGENTGFHQIDHNYYGQRPRANANGFETIRVGSGRSSHVDSHVVVENNVFEEADGEIEIISNKSNYNIYRHNTFLNSAGTLTLRQGTHNIVEGNYFLGQLRPGSGGVRVISTNQLIINNYFENLAGRAEGAISITAGNGLLSGSELSLYPRVENSLIIGNVCLNSGSPCVALNASFGSRDRTLIANNLLIANNTFYREEPGHSFVVGQVNESIIWSNNIASGSQVGYDTDGVLTKTLSLDGVFEKVHKVSPQLPPFSCGNLDRLLLKGQWGDVSKLKQLCHKVELNKRTLRAPLFRDDVGPTWLKKNALLNIKS